MRAKLEKERNLANQPKFIKSSLKYGKNPDISSKYVGVPWRLLDSSKLMNSNEKVQTDALKSNWKSYNEYDSMGPHQKYKAQVKNNLKHEINNLTLDIALKNEEMYKTFNNLSAFSSPLNGRKTTYGSPKFGRTPNVEAIERNFAEHARFFGQRIQGVKRVPPPYAERNEQLLEEE